MSRDDIREKFRQALALIGSYNLMISPHLSRIPQGRARTDVHGLGNPTYNPRGWKGPCYLMTDAHHDTYKELHRENAVAEIRPGHDPRCEDCMVHVGFEPSPVLGAQRQFGDNWKLLKWQFAARWAAQPRAMAPDAGPERGPW